MSSEVEDFLFDAFDATSTAAGCLEAAIDLMEEDYPEEMVTELMKYQRTLKGISVQLEDSSYYKKDAA